MSGEVKERLTKWLRSAPSVRGMLVRGVRFRDQSFLSDVDSHEFPAEALEQAWRIVDDTFHVLRVQHFPPTRLSWHYERTVLHCVQRPDGAILGVFVTRKHAQADTEGLNRLLAEFQNLELADFDEGIGAQ